MEIYFRPDENLLLSRRRLRPVPVALFRRHNPEQKKEANLYGSASFKIYDNS
ncbi:MAG: hypothetical protein LBK03_07070 [Bacteroidales bacterium]|nr:hypothetical protein [Bacteroidales bacterium]